MNNINQNILDSIDLIVSQRLKQLEFDITITAKVVEIFDTKCKILYSGNIFDATIAIPNIDLSICDYVYVIVIRGDLSNEKIIIGIVPR